jgi:hypothetical protein
MEVIRGCGDGGEMEAWWSFMGGIVYIREI